MRTEQWSWDDVDSRVRALLDRLPMHIVQVYGLRPHGSVVAHLVALKLATQGLRAFKRIDRLPGTDEGRQKTIVVDAIDAGGERLRRAQQDGMAVGALARRGNAGVVAAPKLVNVVDWVVLPWEPENAPTEAYRALVRAVGLQPDDRAVAAAVRGWLRLLPGSALQGDHIEPRGQSTGGLVVSRCTRFVAAAIGDYAPRPGRCWVGYDGAKTLTQPDVVAIVQQMARTPMIASHLAGAIGRRVESVARAHGVGVVVEMETWWQSTDMRAEPTAVNERGEWFGGTMDKESDLRGEFLRAVGY